MDNLLEVKLLSQEKCPKVGEVLSCVDGPIDVRVELRW